MHARVTTAYVQPEKVDEVIQMYRNTVVPAAKQQQGCKGLLQLVDRATGKGISIGLWETEADLQASETSFYREQLARGANLFTDTPVRETYEVSIQQLQQARVGSKARVLIANAHSGKTDELVRIVRDSIIPAAKQQQGFNGILLLNDHATSKGISITFWETEADMKASETSGYLREQLAKLANVLATQVVREAYEVSVQE